MHSPIGKNHAVRMSQFDSSMPPPIHPGPSYVRGVVTRPFVVPKFVSELQMVKTGSGYQDAHAIYDDMRQFFAQRAMSNGEVVVIKVTMMLLKPGNRNPSVVSVHETSLSHPLYLSLPIHRIYQRPSPISLFTLVFRNSRTSST